MEISKNCDEIISGYTGMNDCCDSNGTTGIAGSCLKKTHPKKWYDNDFINKKYRRK